MSSRPWVMLAVFVLICLAGGLAGSYFTFSAIPTWYAALSKPAWTPPDAVFGPVWTALYVMIGIAGWLVWRRGLKSLLIVWWIQLALNFLWTPIFFGAREIGWALLEIFCLWLAVGSFLILSWKRARAAAGLFMPYLGWVSYASALNFAIWTRQ